MRREIVFVTGFLLMVLVGCTKYEIPAPELPDGIPTGVSFSADVQPIFNSGCISCHGGATSPDLTEDWAYDELIDGEYVNTDEPLESPLYQIFQGTHDGRASEDEILNILGWIVEGAEDN